MPITSITALWGLGLWKPFYLSIASPARWVLNWAQGHSHSGKDARSWSGAQQELLCRDSNALLVLQAGEKQSLTNTSVALTQSAWRPWMADSSCKRVLSIRMISLLFIVLLQSGSAMQSTLQAQITALILVIKDCNQNFKIYWAEIQC